jgi:hypothetical protein
LSGNHYNSRFPLQISLQRVVATSKASVAQSIEKKHPGFSKLLEAWFTVAEVDPRSAKQLEREKYVFWLPWTGKFKRWMIIIPSFVIQLCVGSVSGSHRVSLQHTRPC